MTHARYGAIVRNAGYAGVVWVSCTCTCRRTDVQTAHKIKKAQRAAHSPNAPNAPNDRRPRKQRNKAVGHTPVYNTISQRTAPRVQSARTHKAVEGPPLSLGLWYSGGWEVGRSRASRRPEASFCGPVCADQPRPAGKSQSTKSPLCLGSLLIWPPRRRLKSYIIGSAFCTSGATVTAAGSALLCTLVHWSGCGRCGSWGRLVSWPF